MEAVVVATAAAAATLRIPVNRARTLPNDVVEDEDLDLIRPLLPRRQAITTATRDDVVREREIESDEIVLLDPRRRPKKL